MNFQEAEKKYNDLRTQHNAGKLSDADFEAEVGKLKLQDDQGRWWMIGVQSGEWYMHDGQKWAKGKPPVQAAPAPAATATTPAPAEPSRKPAEKTKPVVEDKAKPAADDKAKAGGGLPARLFSAKPAGREGGKPLSRNVIIGIVAAVVVLLLICIGVGYFVILPNVMGTSNVASRTNTPTVAVAKASPTGAVVIPTLPPVATNTPFIAPTVPLPPPPISTTIASSSSASSKATGPTATRRPATTTPTKPATSPTPAAPPGVYVTKISTDPVAPNFNEPMGFKVTFFNNTGSVQTYTWKVKIYKCAGECAPEDLAINKSVGETVSIQSNFAVGSEEQVLRKNWQIGVGVCTIVLNPYYMDGNSNLVPFTMPDGKQIFQTVNMCR